ncbi:hypothetical protein STCU_00231 [Strigomonas culicis]|uniref:Uncharacterized protein n=1 Tax=Strigomonas culicis TaxID=28005 RepID=S9WD42_9TRYP|nr:hypothetical protein STCU_00231 [Strigomonas culicis]|eukprot:EPY37066.1 hypothetical protein STCU_00231 [Strigomonas culicis]
MALHRQLVPRQVPLTHRERVAQLLQLLHDVPHTARRGAPSTVDIVDKVLHHEGRVRHALRHLVADAILEAPLVEQSVRLLRLHVPHPLRALLLREAPQVRVGRLAVQLAVSPRVQEAHGAVRKVKLCVVLGELLEAEVHRLADALIVAAGAQLVVDGRQPEVRQRARHVRVGQLAQRPGRRGKDGEQPELLQHHERHHGHGEAVEGDLLRRDDLPRLRPLLHRVDVGAVEIGENVVDRPQDARVLDPADVADADVAVDPADAVDELHDRDDRADVAHLLHPRRRGLARQPRQALFIHPVGVRHAAQPAGRSCGTAATRPRPTPLTEAAGVGAEELDARLVDREVRKVHEALLQVRDHVMVGGLQGVTAEVRHHVAHKLPLHRCRGPRQWLPTRREGSKWAQAVGDRRPARCNKKDEGENSRLFVFAS